MTGAACTKSMTSKNVVFFFGTRPEAIKLAPVIAEMRRFPRLFTVRVVATAQHRQMLDQVLRVFEITPDVDLDVMRPRQTLATLTARLLAAIDSVLTAENPDLVIVQGDTTSAMVSALAAFYLHIPVAHVEAGLRTGDPYAPFPEETNRRLIASLSTVHFAPTLRARDNLVNEGIPLNRIHVTGNTAVDALLAALKKSKRTGCPIAVKGLDPRRRLLLVTGHRRESFGPGFERICKALVMLVKRNPNVEVVYPIHLNPRVREPVRRALKGVSRIHLIEPLEYLPFVQLMKRACLILTDSGGIQEEAPTLGKPVLVLRDKTERLEGLQSGTARLTGTAVERIVRETERLLRSPAAYRRMSLAVNPYGDGKAAVRIRRVLARMLHRAV